MARFEKSNEKYPTNFYFVMCIDTVLSEHKPANTRMARKEPRELLVLDSLFHFLPQGSMRGFLCEGILSKWGLGWRHWFAVCIFPVVVNKEVFVVSRAAWKKSRDLMARNLFGKVVARDC